MPIPEDHHDIRGRTPDLEAIASSPDGQECRRTPSFRSAACHQPFTIITSHHEGELLFTWNNGNAFCGFHQLLRHGLVWRTHNLLKHLSGATDARDIVTPT